MKTPEIPAPQDKCGVKNDYVARRLGLALSPRGFKRKGRQLVAARGRRRRPALEDRATAG